MADAAHPAGAPDAPAVPGAELERQISAWRGYVSRHRAIGAADVDELEDHLRGEVDRLEQAGLAPDEAFLVAVKRLGRLDALSREYAREHSDRLWKQLVLTEAPRESQTRAWAPALGLAIGAAVAVKAPALFGIGFGTDPDFYARYGMLLVLPFLAAYFLIRRRATWVTTVAVSAPFVLAAFVLTLFPFGPDADTLALTVIHGAVALWLVIGIAYANGDVRSSRARMDFVRFTGEWFVYYVLIALGGAVLVALTMAVFSAIAVDAAPVTQEWVVPCGAAGAVVIAAWLVEAKQAVVENIAPVLTRLFTPLFTLLLLAFIVVGLLHGGAVGAGTVTVFTQRDLLIVFDVVLVVVLGLLLYAISARDALAPPTWFDRLQLLLLAAAIVVDAMVLAAMIGRITEFGASANKLASLGLNLILLANLLGASWLQLRFVMRAKPFDSVERWQTGFLPVYLGWAAVVAVVFPPVFAFA